MCSATNVYLVVDDNDSLPIGIYSTEELALQAASWNYFHRVEKWEVQTDVNEQNL